MNKFLDISTPKNRERLLLIAAGIVFAIVVIPIFYHLFGSEVAKLRKLRTQRLQEVQKLEADVRTKDQIAKRLADLTEKSLPPGDLLVQSLYQNWLLDTAYAVGLRENRVDPGSIAPLKDYYKKYTFTLHGRGTLEQIAEFLRRFHRTDYLHLIRKVSPRPIKNSAEMDVSITVEALTLPQASASKTLRSISDESLIATDAEKKTLKEITERNLFATYVPPVPPGETPRPAKPDDFDQSPYCFVTGIVAVDDKPQVWVDLRTEGKKYKLYEGEMFRLGGVRCFVKKIESDRVQFEAAGGFYTIKLGKSFAEYE